MTQPDPSPILERLSIKEPLIGFYDAPDPSPFEPLVVPGGRQCVFASFKAWHQAKTLHLTREKPGCGGSHLLGEGGMSREELVEFLCAKEGLRADNLLMNQWLDSAEDYSPVHDHLLIGPLRHAQYDYLRTITFYVNADQLAILCTGATYYTRPSDLEPVLSRFGSGCMQLITLFDDLDAPQAIIGSTDQAMRKFLEPWMLAFTVTRPMFERLCRWGDDRRSSLHSGFTDDLIRARGGSLA
ncbi:MAG: DUF169 domain-containing protein [Thermoleophilia bacterium]|nr:DUF169 domain-containing protein [Thermoleophilia bacterium]